jgi:hypothetical protein
MRRGEKMSLDQRQRTSNTLKGHTTSQETRAKISATIIEYQKNPETRIIISKGHKGKKLTEEHIKKRTASQTGLKRSPIAIANLTAAQNRPEVKLKQVDMHAREKSNFWKGGISFEPYCPKFNNDLRRRIRAFFKDRCMICGKSSKENNRKLCCHHVEYNKSACCDGKPIHFSALCHKCHSKTNIDRVRWEAMLHRIIDEIYDGRSYFTRDEWKTLK